MKTKEVIQKQARIFQSLASPIRLALVLALYEKDRCVNELVEIVSGDDSLGFSERTGISKHLAVLRRWGLISYREASQKRVYHLEARCLVDAIECTIRLVERQGCSSRCVSCAETH